MINNFLCNWTKPHDSQTLFWKLIQNSLKAFLSLETKNFAIFASCLLWQIFSTFVATASTGVTLRKLIPNYPDWPYCPGPNSPRTPSQIVLRLHWEFLFTLGFLLAP